MSYQVLARKWRPRDFSELAGQEHVQRALINALNNDRLHHAFLFTGTRGVGKTTIARILAKSLNCETGITATPCGKCSACVEINEGRFIDLIEVDAASKTKVEDTRELLENVQYLPTRGRFKVYLVDEVHMLSNSSFNALLKTLEEPPPHVKFLLATTDPQKLPVTILSRCLQFNLKRLPATLIAEHLQKILTQEHIGFDDSALAIIADAADGSMRDALSLLDQAIAYGAGELKEPEVRTMLGTIDTQHVYDLMQALANRDARQILAYIEQLATFSADFDAVLSDLLSILHQIAVAQIAPLAIDNQAPTADLILQLANKFTAEDIQLYYQIGLTGRRDLPFAPNPKLGFEMTLLRMLAFTPDGASVRETENASHIERTLQTAVPEKSPTTSQPAIHPKDQHLDAISKTLGTTASGTKKKQSEMTPAKPAPIPQTGSKTASLILLPNDANEWESLVEALPINGITQQLARNCAFMSCTDTEIELALAETHQQFLNEQRRSGLQQAITSATGANLRLNVLITAEAVVNTPALREQQRVNEMQKSAESAIYADENVRTIIEAFDAKVLPKSIEPVN